jgi:hypothetical protein
LYGSKAAKEEGLVSKNDSHSKLVGRGKYVHEKVTHSVIPSKREEYLETAEKYYKKLMERGIDELGGVKLTASWETVVGSVGEFTHVLEYEGFKGFDETSRALRKDKVSTLSVWINGEGLNSRKCRSSILPFYPTSPLDNTRSSPSSPSGPPPLLETLDIQMEEYLR